MADETTLSDLCTANDVLAFVSIPTDGGVEIVKLIEAASIAIRKHTGMTFGPVVTEERVVRVNDAPTAYVRELREVTAVVDAYDNAVSYTADETDSDGHIKWLEFPYRRNGLVYVTGEWGWDEIPADVAIYCAQTVADWYKRDQAITANPLGDIGFDGTRRTRLLPPYVAEGLESYCHREF